MRGNNLITKMIQLVGEAHGSQKYGDMPYMYHIKDVFTEVREFIKSHPQLTKNEALTLKLVALGHDVVEDTPVTLSQLTEEGFPQDVVDGIDGMTKRKGESPVDYIKRVKANPFSHTVKKCDSLRNLTHSVRDGDTRRVLKYIKYLGDLHE
jgi:(p)ppGpp synthase/HD superfamily hydrolase